MPNGAVNFDGAVTAPGLVALRRAPAVRPTPASIAPSSTCAAADVRAQLERLLASEAFDATARNRAFLNYVVHETLAGRGDQIKAYTVAQDVFQRGTDFDPQHDPVVRIEAANLRRSLQRYYLTAGKDDRLVIDIPKGGYVPRFETRTSDVEVGRTRPVMTRERRNDISSTTARDPLVQLVLLGKHVLAVLWVIALLLFALLLR